MGALARRLLKPVLLAVAVSWLDHSPAGACVENAGGDASLPEGALCTDEGSARRGGASPVGDGPESSRVKDKSV